MDEYLVSKKFLKLEHSQTSSFFRKYVIKLLILIIVTLILLITMKVNNGFKSFFYKNIYDNNFSFAKINNYYEKIFGSPLPFKNLFKDSNTSMVFSEKIKYSTVSKYYDGIVLGVSKNLLVPIMENGMVVFVGEKENYGKTVIIEGIDGVDIWYGNLESINVNMYDYVEKGKALGSTSSDKLYLVFKKDGEVVDYENYI